MLVAFILSLLVAGAFGDILVYKKNERSLTDGSQCPLSNLKRVSLPDNAQSCLQLQLDASEFAAAGGDASRRLFKNAYVNFYDRRDRQVAALQLTLLRDRFVQVTVAADRKNRELSSTWEPLDRLDNLKISLESGSVYLNGRRLLFQMRTKVVNNVNNASPSNNNNEQHGYMEKPAEWMEIENFLASELQQPIHLQWQQSSAGNSVTDRSQEQVFVNQVAAFELPLQAVAYVTFDAQTVTRLSLEQTRSLKQQLLEALQSHWSSLVSVDKEQVLMGALVVGFVGYLAVLTLLARITSPSKSAADKRRQKMPINAQQQQQLHSSTASIVPLAHDSRSSLYRHPSSPLSTSQTKSTDTLRPILLARFNRSSQLALLNTSSMHLEIQQQLQQHQQQQQQQSKEVSQSGNVHELSAPSLSFSLADNRHILFPSKLRNYQK